MTTPYKKLTILDIVIILLCLGTAIAVFPFIRSHSPNMVVVYRIDRKIAEYPLGKDREFQVQGLEGPMLVRIKDKAVSVAHSSCRNQICVRTPSISRAGSQIVCAPNRIIVMIESKEKEKDVDGTGR